MPGWFWYIPAALIVGLTLYVFWRHFFKKKGNCCDNCDGRCEGCSRECGKKK